MGKDNLRLWDKVSKTNPKYTKEDRSRGFKMTSIAPHYQLMCATKTLGIFGTKFFRIVDEKFKPLEVDDDTILVLYTATLECEFEEEPISIPLHASDYIKYKTKNGIKTEKEFAKKVATDALTKGLSKLGFNADVFMGMFDDATYVKRQRRKFDKEEEDEED